MSSFPLFAPDGSVRQVPQGQLQDALNAGGKLAVRMTDPSGTLRFVPSDQVEAAKQAGGTIYQAPASFWQDPKTFLQQRAQEMGQSAQNEMNQATGPESQGKSLVSRMGHAMLSGLPAIAEQVDKFGSALVGTDAGTWRNAAMVAAGAIDPAIPGAYFATQGTGQLTGLTPGVTPGDLSPENVQNFLNAGASIAGGASAASAPASGTTLRTGPAIVRGTARATNAVLSKAPEYVMGGAGAAIGGAIGGGYGAGIGGTVGAIAGRTLPKFTIPGENFGLPQSQTPGIYPGAPLPAAPPAEVLQAGSLYQLPEQSVLPASQTGEALGQIPRAQISPAQATEQPMPQATAQPQAIVSAPAQPMPMLQFEPVQNSSQIAGHTYDPQSQTATIQFRNGQMHQYMGVTADDWQNYRSAASPGKGFNAFIKRDPATGAGRMSRPLSAISPKTAEAPPANGNELLERYIGLM